MPVVDILCPTARKWDPEQCFAFSHVLLHAFATGVLRTVRYRKWMYIDQARNELVAEVLDNPGATHVLFLDDDMTFLPDLVARLLAHEKPVVGGMYFTRVAPHDVVCGDFYGDQARNLSYLPQGLTTVGWVGGGVMLIEVSVLEAMASPSEAINRLPDGSVGWFRSDHGGEDVHFCRHLRDMGIPVHVDGSLICGHVADQVIMEEHWRHYHGGER